MRFIHVWSYCCANYLIKQLNENHEKRRVYYFGFQVIIGAIVKAVLLVASTLLLGTLAPTLIGVLVFSSLRVIAGGYHMDTYGKCILTSLALFIIAGLIAQYTWQYWLIQYVIALVAFSFVTALAIILKWAPKDTPNRPITEPHEIKKFRRLSIIHITVWLTVVSILIFKDFKMYAIAASFGLLLEVFTITPLGHKFFDAISGRVDKIKASYN